MINFIVVDDNNIHRKKVCKTITTHMMNNRLEFSIKEFCDYNKDLLNYIKSNRTDAAYFIDLELPNGDGIDIARKIRYDFDDWVSPIIIVTAHTSLYYEVYKQRLQLLDFVSKCDDAEKNIKENLDICLKMLNKDRAYRYIYNYVEYTIPFSKIDYIIKDGRRSKIVTSDNIYYQNISISNIKKMFPKYFLNSAKGTIINMKNVNKIDWNTLRVYFKDKNNDYLVTLSHKKELDAYEYD